MDISMMNAMLSSMGWVVSNYVIGGLELTTHNNIAAALATWVVKNGRIILGFGHRFHNLLDPRAPSLLALVAEAVEDGACSQHFSNTAKSPETKLR